MSIPRTQYHATRPENIDLIRSRGLLLPGEVRVETHRYEIPSISTVDNLEDARVYHPSGMVLVLRVRPGFKYLTRSIRSMKRGENLEGAVNRWLREAQERGATGIYVGKGLQSSVGNQTLIPEALEIVGAL